ncbi:unnamed protein product [Symbiodinium necroappetens]|uniref:Uncharacterized protein n=1 Tax=Symbiodinium necroappetens TaxID=1628268 RepID=A0A812KC11_9DINO|nr:unnamed protein product [Symbiodinium necroappetens]
MAPIALGRPGPFRVPHRPASWCPCHPPQPRRARRRPEAWVQRAAGDGAALRCR